MFDRLGAGLGGLRLHEDEVAPGVRRLRVSSRVTRLNGMTAVCYYLAGGLLIDSGFAHAGRLVLAALAGRSVEAVALTHHHEDHAGNAGVIAAAHGCPVFLRATSRRLEEGLTNILPYRRLWWGTPGPYEPEEMPARIASRARALRAVPIPGHSATHTALLDETTGVVFVGDLYITGGATAIMTEENPYDVIASLRRVADLEPTLMLNGHGLAKPDPAPALRAKAERVERAAAEAVALAGAGMPVQDIARRIFRRGHLTDLGYVLLTQGEFSRVNFVRACLRHAAA